MMLKIQTMAQIHTRLYESKQFGKICLSAQIRDQMGADADVERRFQPGQTAIGGRHSLGRLDPLAGETGGKARARRQDA